MADDKKTQLGAGPSRAPSAPALTPPGNRTPEPLTPLATPPPAAVSALATQPSASFSVPTNVPTAAMSAYPEDNLVGRTIDHRFAVSKKLGEGGMGAVYLATHVVLEKPVALKVLHGEYARKPDLVERFIQEARAASRIRHENVIDISDFGATDDGLVYFSMELLKGHDLHELIARARLDGQVLPWDRTRHIFLQVCSALAAAHALGIVHRDLKPENIYLIEFLGRPDFVKLLDFGIAKLGDGDGGERKLTRTGMLFGTPEYMSPEQARGDKVDHRVDIYAMACILHQLLTGRVPFEADNFMGVLSMHLTEPAPEIPLAALERCGAPPELAAIVARGLCKNRDERWQSIEDMARAIRALDGDAEPAAAIELPPTGRARTQWTGSPKVPTVEPTVPPVAAAPRGLGKKLAFGAVAGAVLAAGVVIGLAPWKAAPAPAAPQLGSAAPPPAGSVVAATNGAQPAVDPAGPAPGQTADQTVAPPAVALPEPLPAKVKIVFALPKGVALYDENEQLVGKGKMIELELAGSDTSRPYFARAKGMRERRYDITPDRDARIDVDLDREGDARRATEPRPGEPTASPPSDTPPIDKPPTTPPPGPSDPGEEGGDPVLKDPFRSGKPASGEPGGAP